MKRVYSKGREEDYSVNVDWNLGNSCRLQCSYCHPFFKTGRNPFPEILKAKAIVTKIAEKHRASNRPVRFMFVGGEPTEYADLPELCQHIKETAWYAVHVSSNGMAPKSYWEKLFRWVDVVNISYHEGYADVGHIREVVELLRNNRVKVAMTFPMMPETFDKSLEVYEEFKFRGIPVSLQALYEDHMRRKKIMPYTAEQRALLFPKRGSDIVFERDGVVHEMPSSDHVIYEKKNSFTGMRCGIGTDQIVIDQDGSIRGGWCRVGGLLGNVHEGDFVVPDDGIVCTKETCNNPNDLAVPKWRDGDER